MITSSSPSEGKTTTAANLAVSMAQGGRSVMLVDSDLRKLTLHRVFGIGNQKGLTNVLVGSASLEEATAKTSVEGLYVMPSGPLPPDASPVLRSSRMKEVIYELKTKVDLVILDSAPLLSVTDPMLLTPLVDGVLMVVDANRTGRDTVKRGAETLLQANPSTVGMVLNKVSSRGNGYYYYYSQYCYYSQNGTGGRSNGKHGRLSKVFNGRLAPLSQALSRASRLGNVSKSTDRIAGAVLSIMPWGHNGDRRH